MYTGIYGVRPPFPGAAGRSRVWTKLARAEARMISRSGSADEAPGINLERQSNSPADNDDGAALRWKFFNDVAELITAAKLRTRITDVTDGTEDAQAILSTMIAGTLTDQFTFAKHIEANSLPIPATKLDTEQATTSGSSFTFTSPFATTVEAKVLFEGVSLDDTDSLLVRLGDAGGVEATGYVATSTRQVSSTDAVEVVNATTGFCVALNNAGDIMTGIMTLVLANASNNSWISSHSGKVTTANTVVGGGQKDLSAVLTTITLLDSGGDAFDAGAVNVRWYGYD